MKSNQLKPVLLLAVAPVIGHGASYAPWLTQIGISDSVLSAANWGRGQVLGVVDTGIVANNQVFASGQVSSALSSCAAVSFRCSNGAVDDNGHGTAVASIAAANRTSPYTFNTGGYTITAGSVIGVAPNANIVAEKVLSAAGSGYSTDVANGLKKAADAGATVINLSLTFGNSSDLVAALNYAAAKGAFIVWAGGNSAQTLLAGANTNGLTDAAISHLILAGSVNGKNALSSFSNTPGSGSLVNGSNAKTTYAARWIMAPGESILAPSVTAGANAWGAWSGTSMSAPVVSGSLMLLQSAWPILKTNGTTANLLLATSTDLGTKGVDSAYGNGLVNLATAFQPYGTLAVTQSNGQSIAVGNLTGALISGGALGPLASVQAKLANYTAFDGYARNFSVNLSGLIKSPTTKATVNPLPTNTNTGPVTMKLADGAELAVYQAASRPAAAFGANATDEDTPLQRNGYALLNDARGNTWAFGYGAAPHFAHARALYGDNEWARLSGLLKEGALANLAQGGGLMAWGIPLSDQSRLAFAWSGTAAPQLSGPNGSQPGWSHISAQHFSVGYARAFSERISGSVKIGLLTEQHGLLGTTYDTSAALSLGQAHLSWSTDFSLAIRLSHQDRLLLETSFAHSPGSSAAGLVAGTSALQARGYGMALVSQDVWRRDDRLSLSIQQPLRVVAGSARLVMPTVDQATGVASFGTEQVALAPSGREVDYRLAYEMATDRTSTLRLEAARRRDVLHIGGNDASSLGLAWQRKF